MTVLSGRVKWTDRDPTKGVVGRAHAHWSAPSNLSDLGGHFVYCFVSTVTCRLAAAKRRLTGVFRVKTENLLNNAPDRLPSRRPFPKRTGRKDRNDKFWPKQLSGRFAEKHTQPYGFQVPFGHAPKTENRVCTV